MIIRVADHTRSPGGRFVVDGPDSGEWFRNDVLIPALRQAIERREELKVVLDGTSGYGASFLEEAFGGLIRSRVFGLQDIRARLAIVAETRLFAPYKLLADRYLSAAQRQTAA